LLSKRLNT